MANGQPDAARDLYLCCAPLLYALVARTGTAEPERRVQDMFVWVVRHAHCHARTPLAARAWVLGTAQRAPERPAGT